jgi:hypothetical protein
MSDRELLELAAKAAGVKAVKSPDGIWRDCTGFHPTMNIYAAPPWNPLTDDGDALRLAVKLKMDFNIEFDRIDASAEGGFATEYLYEKPQQTDPYAATRRAIVRAAAEIGKEMK